MGHRLVKDDSPGSIGPTRTGVRMAVLTDRAGGASSMSKAMMEGGRVLFSMFSFFPIKKKLRYNPHTINLNTLKYIIQ